MKWGRWQAPLAAMLLLAGCAAQQSFREGSNLVEAGDDLHGLPKLAEAVRLAPDNQPYRVYYLRQRDLAVDRALARGDAARQQAQWEAAENAYREAATLDPTSQRPAIALESLRGESERLTLLRAAEEAFAARRFDEARDKTKRLLAAFPQDRDAQALLRKIDEQNGALAVQPRLDAALQRPITMEFRDTDLRSVFELISRNTGVNFLFDKDVKPDLRTSIFVRDTSIPDVIHFILSTNQLEQKVLNDNTVLIYPNTAAKAGEYQDLITKSFYLAHADVKQTASMIKTLVKTKDLFVDEKLRLLIMRDRPEAIRMAEKLVANQDLATPEVMLEVEVLEVASGVLTDLGIRYPSQLSASVAGKGGTAGKLTLPELLHSSSGLYQISVTDPLVILNLQQQDTHTNTLANPRIRVKDGEKATIHIGDKVPVITTTLTSNSFASESVSYLDVGLKLEVEPTIALDNEVAIKIGLEVSTILGQVTTTSGTLAYRLGTRNANTVLNLKDGETQILAGLISNDEQKTIDKIPGLGSLPVIGRLFSSHNDNKTKSEIVLLITPRIVRALARPEANMSEFMSGTENIIGAEPMMLRAAPAPAAQATNGRARAGATASVAAQPVADAPPAALPVLPAPDASNNIIVPSPATPSSGLDGSIILQAASQANVGEEYVVAVRMASDNPIRSGTLDMAFDQSRFKITKVEAGELLAQGEQKPSFQYNIQNESGRLSLSYVASADMKGEGNLARITFEVTGAHPGTTIIRVEPPAAADAAGKPVALAAPAPLALSVVQ